MSFYQNTLEQAAKWASIEFGRLITIEALRAKTKARSHTAPRFFVMAYLDATGKYSQPQIAKMLHLGDHTTVLNGLRRAHGYDGKGYRVSKGKRYKIEPLWTSEQFVKMAESDTPEADFNFVSGLGWKVA